MRNAIIFGSFGFIALLSVANAIPTTATNIAANAAISSAMFASQQANIAAQQQAQTNTSIMMQQHDSIVEGVIYVKSDYKSVHAGWNYQFVYVDGDKMPINEYFNIVKPHSSDVIKYIILDTNNWHWSIYYSHGDK